MIRRYWRTVCREGANARAALFVRACAAALAAERMEGLLERIDRSNMGRWVRYEGKHATKANGGGRLHVQSTLRAGGVH